MALTLVASWSSSDNINETSIQSNLASMLVPTITLILLFYCQNLFWIVMLFVTLYVSYGHFFHNFNESNVKSLRPKLGVKGGRKSITHFNPKNNLEKASVWVKLDY